MARSGMANPPTSNPLTSIKGIGPALAERMAAAGYDTVDKVADAASDALSQVQGLSEATAVKVIGAAQSAVPDGMPIVGDLVGGSDLDGRVAALEAAVVDLEEAVRRAGKKAKKAETRAKAAEKAAAKAKKASTSTSKKKRKKKK